MNPQMSVLQPHATHFTDICSTNLVIILVMMQASKKIPFEDPMVLMGVRGLYVLSNIIIFGIYMYVKMQIDKKKGMLPHCLRDLWKPLTPH
jgi:hypothetical protein